MFNIFNIFPQNMHRGYTSTHNVCGYTSTHNVCFGSKNNKIKYTPKNLFFFYIKVGFKGIYIYTFQGHIFLMKCNSAGKVSVPRV